MNYLAHAYLSFEHPEILAGNMISDFVKGKTKYNYPTNIQKGIALHRAIDNFTDTHPVIHLAKEVFRPVYRLYAGAFIDVAFDHFLATDDKIFTSQGLKAFAKSVYQDLGLFEPVLPARFTRMLYYMRTQDWLYNYRFTDGINNSFEGLVRRAAYLTDHLSATEIFSAHYADLKEHYETFFPLLKHYALSEWSNLVGTTGENPKDAKN